MKNRAFALMSVLLLSILPAHTARADDSQSFISFSAGWYDAFNDDDSAVDLRFEYRPASHIFVNNLKPWVGLEVTTHASVWTGGGLLYDWQVSPNVYLTPSLGAGVYSQGNSDIDLGGSFQFRSQLELGFQFNGGSRISAAISNLSNWGIDDENPGTEIVGLYWHMPFNAIFR